jgi:hypothetical protein
MNLNSRGERVAAVNEAHMNESIVEMQRLLKEVVGHLQADTKADKRKAGAKLERLASLAINLGADAQGTAVELRSSPTAGSVRNPMRSAHTSLCGGGSTLSSQL